MTHIKCIRMRNRPDQVGLGHAGGPVAPVESCGWDGDALEAQAFAYLAVRSLKGLPITLPSTTGVREDLTGGVLARP